MSEGTEFVRMSTEEFRHAVATGQMPSKQRGSAHPQGERCTEDGISFDSKTERDFYRHLKAGVYTSHIDAHPTFTLPGGIRYTADFVAYQYPRPPVSTTTTSGKPRPTLVYDVKGRKPGTDFWRLKKLFDASHPLAPLRVVRKLRGAWVEVESAKEWE